MIGTPTHAKSDVDRARTEGADDLHVEYARLGYPSVVDIDWIEMAVDDEMYLEVTDVTIGASR